MRSMLDAFEKSSSLRGETFWLAYTCDACVSQLFRAMDAGEVEQEFGDVVALRIKYMDALIAVDIRNPVNSRAEKGDYLFESGRYEEAIKAYEYALEAKPTSYLSCLNIAKCYLSLQQFESVLEFCARVHPPMSTVTLSPILKPRHWRASVGMKRPWKKLRNTSAMACLLIQLEKFSPTPT